MYSVSRVSYHQFVILRKLFIIIIITEDFPKYALYVGFLTGWENQGVWTTFAVGGTSAEPLLALCWNMWRRSWDTKGKSPHEWYAYTRYLMSPQHFMPDFSLIYRTNGWGFCTMCVVSTSGMETLVPMVLWQKWRAQKNTWEWTPRLSKSLGR